LVGDNALVRKGQPSGLEQECDREDNFPSGPKRYQAPYD